MFGGRLRGLDVGGRRDDVNRLVELEFVAQSERKQIRAFLERDGLIFQAEETGFAEFQLEGAGAFALVLEYIPAELARRVTSEAAIPTIGIGAGPYCDGQVLVSYDAFGLFQNFVPRFVKRYANLGAAMAEATHAYIDEVRSGTFPSSEHSIVAGSAGASVSE